MSRHVCVKSALFDACQLLVYPHTIRLWVRVRHPLHHIEPVVCLDTRSSCAESACALRRASRVGSLVSFVSPYVPSCESFLRATCDCIISLHGPSPKVSSHSHFVNDCVCASFGANLTSLDLSQAQRLRGHDGNVVAGSRSFKGTCQVCCRAGHTARDCWSRDGKERKENTSPAQKVVVKSRNEALPVQRRQL